VEWVLARNCQLNQTSLSSVLLYPHRSAGAKIVAMGGLWGDYLMFPTFLLSFFSHDESFTSGSGMDFQFFRRIVRTRQLKNNNNKTNSLRIDCLQVFFKNPCVVTYL